MQTIREVVSIKNHKIKFEKEVSSRVGQVEIVVLPYKSNQSQKNDKLSSFFRSSPFYNFDLDTERNKSSSRNIDL